MSSLSELEAVTVASSVVNAKLLQASRETKLFVSELLSYEVEGAAQTAAFKTGQWAGRSSFFDFRAGVFPAGFTYMVVKELRRRGHPVRLVMKDAPEPLGPEVGAFDPLGYGFSERYDYQPETVRRLLRYKRMIARIATGGGKSNVAILAYSSIKRMTLFLTTRGALMYQMKDNFEKAGIKPGVIGDSILAPRKGANVAMVQTIASWLEEPLVGDRSDAAEKQRDRRRRMIDLLHKVEFVIGEEAHEAGGNSYFDILSHCVNANYRLALTATPFMRADEEANMRLQAAFGSIGIDVSEKLLIDRGILATPYFKFLHTPQPSMLRRTTRWPTCYDIGIVENVERNKLIITDAIRASKHGRTSLILIQRKKHGGLLEDMLKRIGVKTAFIFGENNQAERQEALRDLASGKLEILIGSTILEVGVDVPAVGNVIMGGGGKAEVGFRQRIGRGLREKKSGPNNCFVTDFQDECNKTLRDHAATRMGIVSSTPGFAEGVFPEGAEFPY